MATVGRWLVVAAVACAALQEFAQGEPPPEPLKVGAPQWDPTATQPATDPIRLDATKGAIRFPGRIQERPTGTDELTAVSQNGRSCAIYDRKTGALQLLNDHQESLFAKKVRPSYYSLAVSNAGLVVAVGQMGAMEPQPVGPVEAFNAAGVRIFARGQVGVFARIVFSPDGQAMILQVRETGGQMGYICDTSGRIAFGQFKPGAEVGGAVFVGGSKRTMLISHYPGDLSAGRPDRSVVAIYDATANNGRDVECPGALLDARLVALSSEGDRLAYAGPNFIACYDLTANRIAWRQAIAFVGTGTIPVVGPARLASVKDRLVAAYLVPTGKSYRFLISVWNFAGQPQLLFTHELPDALLRSNYLLTPEQPTVTAEQELWDIDPNAMRVTLKVSPPTTIDLKRETGGNGK